MAPLASIISSLSLIVLTPFYLINQVSYEKSLLLDGYITESVYISKFTLSTPIIWLSHCSMKVIKMHGN